MHRTPWGRFQIVRKNHILSLLEVKPEFISDISDTQKPAWQHRNTLGFSKDGNQLKRLFPAGPSSWDAPGKLSSCLDASLSVLLV